MLNRVFCFLALIPSLLVLGRAAAQDGAAAVGRARQLEPEPARLFEAVPASSRISGLQVTRNGQPIGEPSWDNALSVNPGGTPGLSFRGAF
jgi:hypothetical protein